MNDLENFRATIAHEPHEQILFYASFTPDLDRRLREDLGLDENADIRRHLGMFCPGGVGLKPPENRETPDYSGYYEDVDKPEGSTIRDDGVLVVPAGYYHFTKMISPLRNATSLEELENYAYPNVEGWRDEGMAEHAAALHEQGRVAIAFVGHIFETSWQIRGMEEFLMDMAAQPDWAELVLDRIADMQMKKSVAAARAGADMLRTGDDVATQNAMMMAPDQWRHYLKPRWAAIYAAAKAENPDIAIWYHSDGNIMDIIPDLIEIGVDILNPVQPECMEPVEVKKRFGDKLALDGTVGTQTTMPFGSADDVRALVRERIDTLGGDGALFLSPTHVLEPEVPLENIYAFAEAAREMGRR
jgi:uroporphyrinogen decarboxylase